MLERIQQTQAAEELIGCIKDHRLANDVRYTAYLSLIAVGSLRHLQQLAPEMDFTYEDERGHAFIVAAMLDKIEVMRWLKNEIPFFRQINFAEQSRIVFLLVKHFKMDALSLIAKPEAEGGFGWSLNICNEEGKTPAMLAAQHGANYFLDTLITKREQGGFGLQLDQAVVDELNQHHQPNPQPNQRMIYHRSRPLERQSSFIELNGEQFYPLSFLSVGAFAIARLFASSRQPANLLMVKQMNPALGKPVSNVEICHCLAKVNQEMQLRRQAYPDDLQHGAKHYLDKEEGYQFRAVTRAVPGESLDKLLLTASSVDKVAVLIHAVVVELHRLHEANIICGNARASNVLLERLQSNQFGLPAYRARFLHFYQGNRIGGIVATDSAHEGYAPELLNQQHIVYAHPNQDVYRFAYSLKGCLEACAQNSAEFAEALDQQFPEIKQFCVHGLLGEPASRPQLSEWIAVLESSLAANEKRLKEEAAISTSFATSASSLWNQHAGKMTVTALAAMSGAMLWRMQAGRK